MKTSWGLSSFVNTIFLRLGGQMILNYILVVKSINENSKAIALQENCKKDSGDSLHYCYCIFLGYMLQWAWNDKLLISMRGLLLYTNLVFIWIVTIFVLF